MAIANERVMTRPVRSKRGVFRPDIQGLRAVAVLLVILHHAGLPALSGGYVGVDVFFVISGFVITQSLLGPDHERGVSLGSFYAARARRILPMGTIVILFTLFASWLTMNYIRAEQVANDSLWATFFVANFHFTAQGTDYFASDVPPSPLQHFWSLNVEEQFYLAWPILLGLLIFGFSFKGSKNTPLPRTRLLAVFTIIVAASFVWSVIQTTSAPTAAYFSPLTRAWELALGGAIVIAAPFIQSIPAHIRATASWAGLVGIGAAAVLYTESTPFPGSAAALPVLGAALVVAGGIGHPAGSATALLAFRPLQALGNWSYSIYLWHWPLLVLAPAALGRELALWEALALVALAVGISAITHRFIELPFIRSSKLKESKPASLMIWPTAIVLGLVSVLFVTQSLQAAATARAVAAYQADPAPAAVSTPEGGLAGGADDPVASAVESSVAQALAGDPIPAALTPSVDDLSDDFFEIGSCGPAAGETTSDLCTFGDENADTTVVIIGDSHAGHWMPALDAAGENHGFAAIPFVKNGCTAANVILMLSSGEPYTECNTWREWALNEASALEPDYVILSSAVAGSLQAPNGEALTDSRLSEIERIWSDGIATTASRFLEQGSQVRVLSDVPGVTTLPTDCLLARDATMQSCSWPQLQRSIRLNAAAGAGAASAGAEYLDLTSWFCANDLCPLVIGNTVAYRDTNHLTVTYAEQLSEGLYARLELNS